MHKRVKANIRVFVRSFWASVLFLVIGLAVVVQLGRLSFPILSDYRSVLENFVSEQLGADVRFETLEADWRGLTPELLVKNLAVRYGEQTVFTAEQVELQWNLLATLSDWRLGLRRLRFQGLNTEFVQQPNGFWRVAGLPEPTTASQDADNAPIVDDPVDIFVFGRRIELVDTTLRLRFRTGTEAKLTVPDIRLENDNRFHRLSAALALEGDEVLSLLVEGYGDPRDESTFTLKGFVQSERAALSKVIATLNRSGLYTLSDAVKQSTPNQGQFSLALWFKGTWLRGIRFSGRTQVRDMAAPGDSQIQWPSRVASEFVGYWEGKTGWRLNLSELQAQWDTFGLPPTTIQIDGAVDAPVVLRTPLLDIGGWHAALQYSRALPEKLAKVLETLNPTGYLDNVAVQWLGKEQGFFNLQANLRNVQASAWQGAPALKGVTGFLESDALGGHIQIDNTSGFSMYFPQIYEAPLTFNSARGDVRWQVYPDEKWVGVSSSQIQLANSEFSAMGRLNLRIPFKRSEWFEPEMTLLVGAASAPVSSQAYLVPKTVPEPLKKWLSQAELDGVGRNVAFLYHGTLMTQSELARVVQLSADVEQAVVRFDSQWPPLVNGKGRLWLDDDTLQVTNLRGDLLGNQVMDAKVLLNRDASKNNHLALQGSIQGETQKALSLLLNSPIQSVLDDTLKQWQLNGGYDAAVDLMIPLGDVSQVRAEVQAVLKDNELALANPDLTFTELNGTLAYSDTRQLHGEALTAKLWGRPINAQIVTDTSALQRSVEVAFSSTVDMEQLAHWTQRPELAFVTGEAPVEGVMTLGVDETVAWRFQAKSPLVGVVFGLPEPLSKSQGQALPSLLTITQLKAKADTPAVTHFAVNVDGILRAQWQNQGPRWQGLSIGLYREPGPVSEQRIVIEGQLDSLDVLAWYESVQQYLAAIRNDKADGEAQVESDEPISMTLSLEADNVIIGRSTFAGAQLKMQTQAQGWEYQLRSPLLQGKAMVFHDERPMALTVERLNLPGFLESSAASNRAPQASQAGSVFGGLQPEEILAADVTLQQVYLGEEDYGTWSFKVRPVERGAMAFDIFGQSKPLNLKGEAGRGAELIWLTHGQDHRTHFSGEFQAPNIGKVLTDFFGEPFLTSKSASLHADLQWSAEPDRLSLSAVQGVVDLSFQRGRFIRGASAGENPLLKLIGLLNFDTLARRLRLDFSDLNPEGMAYESVKGQMVFTGGTIEMKTPLYVDTPSSQLLWVGEIDLREQQVDAQLVATLPIAGNLALAAALTGGLPTAITVFLLGKVFKKQVDKASSLRYDVEGDWNNPKVKFDKVFENTPIKVDAAP